MTAPGGPAGLCPAGGEAERSPLIDLWWRTGPRFRISGRRRGTLVFEPGVGGRLFETCGERTFQVGEVTVWEPPARLELVWRGVDQRSARSRLYGDVFPPAKSASGPDVASPREPLVKPGEKTTVEVRFRPMGTGTLVTVHHRGFASLPADHPVRHGLGGDALSRMIGLWWGELMSSMREHVAAGR